MNWGRNNAPRVWFCHPSVIYKASKSTAGLRPVKCVCMRLSHVVVLLFSSFLGEFSAALYPISLLLALLFLFMKKKLNTELTSLCFFTFVWFYHCLPRCSKQQHFSLFLVISSSERFMKLKYSLPWKYKVTSHSKDIFLNLSSISHSFRL